MRIISGIFKGRKILTPEDIKTRPLKDLAKESIFNIISHSKKFKIDISEAFVLDLFSGIGSFGIECLSRGAKKVIFVENYSRALSILKKNLLNLKINQKYEIIEKDISKDKNILNLNYKFNIIFLDPPFNFKNVKEIFNKINNSKILDRESIIILHRHKNEKDDIPKNFKIIEEKKYGISKIIFLIYLN